MKKEKRENQIEEIKKDATLKGKGNAMNEFLEIDKKLKEKRSNEEQNQIDAADLVKRQAVMNKVKTIINDDFE